jgi:hypothetical protein
MNSIFGNSTPTSNGGFDYTSIKQPAPGQPPVPVILQTEHIEDSNEVNPNQIECGFEDLYTGVKYCEANIVANNSSRIFRFWDTSEEDFQAAVTARSQGRPAPTSLMSQTLSTIRSGVVVKEIAEGPNGYVQLGQDLQETIEDLEDTLENMRENQRSYQVSIPKIADPFAKQRVEIALQTVNENIPPIARALSSFQQQKTAGEAALSAVTAAAGQSGGKKKTQKAQKKRKGRKRSQRKR